MARPCLVGPFTKIQRRKGQTGRDDLDETGPQGNSQSGGDTGNCHKKQETCRDVGLPFGVFDEQRPDQTRCQERVVDALVGSHLDRLREQFRREGRKDLRAAAGPGEDFEPCDIEMQGGDQGNKCEGNFGHAHG